MLIRKNICLSLLALGVSSFPGIAAASWDEIPNTARLLTQITPGVGVVDKDPSRSSLIELAKEEAQESETQLNVEVACQEVFQKWGDFVSAKDDTGTDAYGEPDRWCKGSWQGGHYYGPNGCVHTLVITVDIYCQPRDIQQQQIMSLKQSCEKQPVPECFSADYLKYLSQLKPTTYTDIGEPSG